MTFESIIRKNLLYNSKKFKSYIFANAFVISLLLMYASLLLNEQLQSSLAMKLASSMITYAAYATIVFSLLFLSYIGMSFIKSRGKELGVFRTLGMSAKEIKKMLMIETAAILFVSTFIGIIIGVLGSKVFYLVFAKLSQLPVTSYELHFSAILLSVGVFLIGMLVQVIYIHYYVKTSNVVDLIRSNSMKDLSTKNPFGGISLVFFMGSLLILYVFNQTTFFNDLKIVTVLKQYQELLLPIFVIVFVLSLYGSIAYGMKYVSNQIKQRKRIYYKNILFYSQFEYRFQSFKTMFFLLSILITLSFYFIGFGSSSYIFVDQNINQYIPFDVMIESTETVNKVSREGLEEVIELEEYYYFEYYVNESYDVSHNILRSSKVQSIVISEEIYESITNKKSNLHEDQLLQVHNTKEYRIEDTQIVLNPYEVGKNQRNGSGKIEGEYILDYKKENILTDYDSLVNAYGDFEFESIVVQVVHNTVYERLQGEKRGITLLRTANVQESFYDYLRDVNSDKQLYTESSMYYEFRNDAKSLEPIVREQKYTEVLQVSSVVFFSVLFLGTLFLVASIVVLYYKLSTSIDDEKEYYKKVKTIGVTDKEFYQYLRKQLFVLFFFPITVGTLLGTYFIYLAFSFSHLITTMLVVIGCVIVVFYIVSYFIFTSSLHAFKKRIESTYE